MLTHKKSKRFGQVNVGRPWKVELTGDGQHDPEYEMHDFQTEEEADAFIRERFGPEEE